MARLMILSDRGPDDPDWKGAVIWRTILSLAESHHEILALTSRDLEEIPVTHSRLTVARPVNSWRVDQLPKLARVLLSFQPQVVHTFAVQDGGLWPALTVWPYFAGMCAVIPSLKRFSTVFDREDCGKALANWHQHSSRITVFGQVQAEELKSQLGRSMEIVPLDLDHETSSEESVKVDEALIPVPVAEWANPLQGLNHVRDLLQRHPETTLRIVGGWGHWENSRRREGWQILKPVAARVNMSEPLPYEKFVASLKAAGSLWLEPVKRNSWKFLLCTQLANQLGKKLFVASPLSAELIAGSTANSLSRLYSTT